MRENHKDTKVRKVGKVGGGQSRVLWLLSEVRESRVMVKGCRKCEQREEQNKSPQCGEGNLPAKVWQNNTAGLTAHWMFWS